MNQPITINNTQLIDLWVHGLARNTQSAYRRYANRFFDHVGNKPLAEVTLIDIQSWQLTLTNSANTQRVKIGAIKSLLTFAHKLGVIPVNVGILVRLPPSEQRLAEKILTEAEVQRMIDYCTDPRNRAILRMLYSGGLRVSELCALKWRDLKERELGGQVTIYGKGGKIRTVLLAPGIWNEVINLKAEATPNDPVFISNNGGHLCRTQVFYIVKAAAKEALIEGEVSPHWLRHSHASHSLDRGAPIHLVQQTLGHSSISITEKYLHAKPTDSSALYLPD